MATTLDRPAQILDVATRLFAVRGYAGTTLDDIAAEIGFTKPAIYHWFNSKEQILFEIHRAIVQPALDEVAEIARGGGSPADQLERILRAHVRRIIANVDANRVFATEYRNLTGPQSDEIRDLDHRYDVAVRAVFAAGVEAGVFVDVDPVVAVGTLLSACGWIRDWYRPDGPLGETEIADMVVGMLIEGYRR